MFECKPFCCIIVHFVCDEYDLSLVNTCRKCVQMYKYFLHLSYSAVDSLYVECVLNSMLSYRTGGLVDIVVHMFNNI